MSARTQAAEASPARPVSWIVTNRHTGTVRTYKSRRAATDAADRGDNAYGAICCTTRTVWSDDQ